MDKINIFNRVYQLRRKDIFCVDTETFFKTSTLWNPNFQIMGTETHKRKHWWQFWRPRKRTFVRIMYLGEDRNG